MMLASTSPPVLSLLEDTRPCEICGCMMHVQSHLKHFCSDACRQISSFLQRGIPLGPKYQMRLDMGNYVRVLRQQREVLARFLVEVGVPFDPADFAEEARA